MTKLVFISDSHNHHPDIRITPCLAVIHTGDCTNKGKLTEIVPFLNWLANWPAQYKIYVPGNHERSCFSKHTPLIRTMCRERGIQLLIDEGFTIPEPRITFWGCPLLIKNRDYKNLPPVDILLTHEPAFERLDLVTCRPMRPFEDPSGHLGHRDLIDVHCKIHACGHIHQARGQLIDHTLPGRRIHRINSALCDELSSPPQLIHQSIIVDWADY